MGQKGKHWVVLFTAGEFTTFLLGNKKSIKFILTCCNYSEKLDT